MCFGALICWGILDAGAWMLRKTISRTVHSVIKYSLFMVLSEQHSQSKVRTFGVCDVSTVMQREMMKKSRSDT